MNIAIPVSAHDKHLLPTFVKVLQHFGGLEDTPVCFFATPSAKAEAYEAATSLNTTVHTFEVDFAGGWPVASGSHFAATVFTLPKIGWNAPWLWMELDMLPVQKGWLQSLRNGYQLCGKPFMGNVVPTAWVEDGKLVVKEDDDMMMGCGVYPANMHADERFRPLLADLVKPPPRNPNTPFDFYLRHAMRHAGFADTKLIADMWQTREYKRTGKGITCKPVPLDKPRRERGGLVPSEAVVVHGCKDGTLAELVLASGKVKVSDVVDAVLGTANTTLSKAAMVVAYGEWVAKSPPPDKTALDAALKSMVEHDALESLKEAAASEPPKEVAHPTLTEKWAADTVVDEKSFSETAQAVAENLAKPKPPTRTAVEALRKSKKGVAVEIARALNLSIGDFAKLLPTLGYVIAKGGKLKSTI